MRLSSVAIPALLGLAGPAAAQQFGAPPVGPAQVAATGTTQPRAVADHLGDTIKALNFAGCKWDGAHDVSSCIQQAINAAASRGGGEVDLPVGTWPIASTITVSSDNIRLGSVSSAELGFQTWPTILQWTGATGGTMLLIGKLPSPTYGAYTNGARLSGILLDGQSRAAIGAKFLSVKYGNFSVGAKNTTSAGIIVDTTPMATSNDVQGNHFSFEVYNSTQPGDGVVLQATGNITGQPVNSDICLNIFDRIYVEGGAGWALRMAPTGTDNNIFNLVDLFSYGNPKHGLLLDTNNYGNTFRYLNTGGAPIQVNAGSFGNTAYRLDTGNGTTAPTLAPASGSYGPAEMSWNDSEDYAWGFRPVMPVVVDSAGSGDTYSLGGHTSPTASLQIVNNSANHLQLASPDGTHRWGINLSGDALRVLNLAGSPTGDFEVYPLLTAEAGISVPNNGISIGSGGLTVNNNTEVVVNAGPVALTYAGATLSLGAPGTAGLDQIKFYSGGANPPDQDSRIVATSGNATDNQGALSYVAGQHNFYGNITFDHNPVLPLTTPGGGTAACSAGQITADANYIYVCSAANTWKSEPLLSYQAAPVTSLGGMTGAVTCGSGVTCSAGTISASGGGSYTLPTASTTTLGGIKPDGSTIAVNSGTGVASVGTVPAASVSGLAASATTNALNASNITSGTLPAAQLPAATSSTPGGVTVGSGLSVTSGTVSLATPVVVNSGGVSLTYAGATLSLGAPGTAGLDQIKFYSGGASPPDQDSRIVATSGNATDNQGALSYVAGQHNFYGNITFDHNPVLPLTTPGGGTAACSAGQITADANYIYVCSAANTWKSEPLLSYQAAPVTSLGGMTGAITCGSGVTCSAGTISASGGGSYTLPTASTTTLGGIKPDGSTIAVNSGTGVASVGTVPAASVSGLAASATTNALNASNITSGTLPAAQLPAPTASTLGGVKSAGPVANSFIYMIDTAGNPVFTQPQFSGIGGTLSAAQLSIALPSTPTTSPECGSGAGGAVAACASTMVLPNGATATTQTAGDTSAKLATDQFAANAVVAAIPAAAGQLLGGSGTAGAAAAITLSSDFSLSGGTLGIVSTIPAAGLVASNGSATLAPALSGLTFSGSTLSLNAATASALGGVKPDGTTITNASGAISVTYGNTANTALQGTAIPSVVTGAPVCGTGSAGAVGACGGYLIPTAYLGGRYIDAYVPGATKGSVVPTGNSLRALPYIIPPGSPTLKTFSIEVNGAPTTAWGWHGCLYADNGSGLPGNLVSGSDTGAQTTGTTGSTAITYTYGTPLTIPGGLYWAAVWFNTTGAGGTVFDVAANSTVASALTSTIGSASIGGALAGGGNPAWVSTTNTTYGACPSTFGSAVTQSPAWNVALGF